MKYTYSQVKKSFHNQEPWLNVLLIRYITLPLTFIVVNYTKITPNIISAISLIFGIMSAFFYFSGDLLLGAIMYLISYVFDAIDGKVARLTNTGKVYGAWLDIFIDRTNMVLISTAISYNFYITNQDYRLMLLNSFFLGFLFIGFESRYNIDFYKYKKNFKVDSPKSKFKIWCKKKGLIYEPISLVEIFIFYIILSPLLGIELYTCVATILFLILRIIKQQFFWKYVSKNK